MKPKYDKWRNHDTGEIEDVVGECFTAVEDLPVFLRRMRRTLPFRGEGETQVLHKCGNGKATTDTPRLMCKNPDHLYLGSQSENIADAHHQNPEAFSKAQAKSREALLKRREDPAFDAEYRRRVSKGVSDHQSKTEVRKAISDRGVQAWADPGKRERIVEGLRKWAASPEETRRRERRNREIGRGLRINRTAMTRYGWTVEHAERDRQKKLLSWLSGASWQFA